MQNTSLRVSVALATYNGENFILEQLTSIFLQTKKVDEVIIYDDGSTDETPQIVRTFITDHDLESNWLFYINKQKKGAAYNFIDIAQMTTGDVVFYCDQDDIWCAEKVEYMLDVFTRLPDVKLLSINTDHIDERGRYIRTVYTWQKEFMRFIRQGRLKKISFCAQIRSNNDCPGHEMAFRREVIEICAPIIVANKLSHDNPLGLIMSAKGGYYRLNKKLMKRRIHINSTSTPQYRLVNRIRNVDIQIKGRLAQLSYINGCLEAIRNDLDKKDLKRILDFKYVTEKSITWIKKRNFLCLFIAILYPNLMINRTIMIINLLCALYSQKGQAESRS